MTEELYARLYLDEDVPHLLGHLMTERGFSVTTTSEMGNLGLLDEPQLAYAASQGRVLVTHNRGDFDHLAKQWQAQGRSHAGIVLAVKRTESQMATRLAVLLNKFSAEEMVNQVHYI